MYENRFMKVGPRGQITIPINFRKKEGIRPNDLIRVCDAGGYLIVRKATTPSPEEDFIKALQSMGLSEEKDWAEIERLRDEE